MSKQVFYDPQRKRWKRLRRIFDVLALLGALVGIFFVVGLVRMKPMQGLDLRSATKRYRAIYNPPAPELKSREKLNRSAHRKTDLKPSDVTLNQGEGLRAAFYTDLDPASYASFKEHVKQIDLLFPEWLHVISPDGSLTAYTSDNIPFAVVDSAGVHGVDRQNKILHTIQAAREDTEIFPMVNNYSPTAGVFEPNVEQFLLSPSARANFVHQVDQFLATNTRYRGLTLDFQALPPDAQVAYSQLAQALYADFHPRNLRLYINVPVDPGSLNLKFLAAHSDGLVLMNYGEHQYGTDPGPIAAQDWFENNLRNIMKVVPREKIICSIGGYGYDWSTPLQPPVAHRKGHPAPKPPAPDYTATMLSTQEAWQAASDADAKITLDPDSLNPHFAYDDEDAKEQHTVWFLDAVTALNQMRVARALGIQTFAIQRLGLEDDSLWKIWDNPLKSNPVTELAQVAPGQDVDTEGDGDILRVTGLPQNGHRTLTMDDDPTIPKQYLSIVSESMDSYPLPYTLSQYGYHPKEVAISFDDGPDPEWTPRILAILKQYHVVGTFFMIGEVAQDNIGLMKHVYRDGNEVGNHTYTHPDISEISQRQVDLQLNLTERLFAAELGVQPVYFRPPYSIDQEPDTNDQAAPIDAIQRLGYVIVGDKIDTNDWDEHPRKSPQEIVNEVFSQIAEFNAKPWTRGSIILMHDGGGDRSATVAALPVLINALRAHGYTIVPVSQLIGKTRAEVMPPIKGRQRYYAFVDSIAFFLISFFNNFVIGVFFIGDILMSGRLIIIGLFATIDRFRKRKDFSTPGYQPRVAVLIPAYNEEKVIARTIRSVLMSNYKNIRIIVIDDGSSDATFKIASETYAKEIAAGRVYRPHQAQRRQGRRPQLRPRPNRRGDLRRHRRRRSHRPRCDNPPRLPLRQPPHRRRSRQRQGRQPHQPLDPLAGPRIHHQPKLRAPRLRPIRRRHGRSRSHRSLANLGRQGGRRLPPRHRSRGRRPHHEPPRAGLRRHLRRPGPRLHRSPRQRQLASPASASAGPSASFKPSSNIAEPSPTAAPWASSPCPTSSSSRSCFHSSRRSSTSCSSPASSTTSSTSTSTPTPPAPPTSTSSSPSSPPSCSSTSPPPPWPSCSSANTPPAKATPGCWSTSGSSASPTASSSPGS